jgi:glutamate/aspartate transport system substrate-binding protein
VQEEIMKPARLLVVLACAALAGAAFQASAQELTGTLAKIKRSGAITLGVRDGSIPFSFLDDKQGNFAGGQGARGRT